MRYIIEPGTDAAALCFFDPSALPEDFYQQVMNDPVGTLDNLAKEGRAWSTQTDSDGCYAFHFHVDEEVPPELRQRGREAGASSRFVIPSGTIWCCGSEYAARDPLHGHPHTPRGGLGRYSHMGGKFEVVPGEYSLKVWELDWPEDYVENEVRKAIGACAARRENIFETIAGVMFVGGGFLCLLLLALKTRTWWAWGSAGCISALGLLVAKVMAKSPTAKRVDAIQRELPAYAVELRRLHPDTAAA